MQSLSVGFQNAFVTDFMSNLSRLFFISSVLQWIEKWKTPLQINLP